MLSPAPPAPARSLCPLSLAPILDMSAVRLPGSTLLETWRQRSENALESDRSQDVCGAENATLAEDASAGRRHQTTGQYQFTSRTEVILPAS